MPENCRLRTASPQVLSRAPVGSRAAVFFEWYKYRTVAATGTSRFYRIPDEAHRFAIAYHRKPCGQAFVMPLSKSGKTSRLVVRFPSVSDLMPFSLNGQSIRRSLIDRDMKRKLCLIAAHFGLSCEQNRIPSSSLISVSF